MKWLGIILLIFTSFSAHAELLSYSGGESKPIGVSDGLLRLEVNYSKSHYTLDVINEFANQLRVESGNADEYEFRTSYYFTKFIYSFLQYKYSVVDYENTPLTDLEKTELEYHDYQIGAGYNIGALGLKLGYGGSRYHTFLETDTALYFEDELNSQFAMAGLDYKFETKFGFNVEMFLDLNYYIPSAVDAYDIEEGYVRKWGGRMTFSRGRYQYGLGYTHTHRSVKMIHNFFSLQNEMNNKMTANQFFGFLTAGF